MNKYYGKRVFEGYAIGKIIVYRKKEIIKGTFSSPQKEYERFEKARKDTSIFLDKLYLESLTTLGKETSQIFLTHKLMLEDFDFEDLVKKNILNNQVAEEAIENACNVLSNTFKLMTDEYMKLRAVDIIEVGEKVINFLQKNNDESFLIEPSIIVCEDLSSQELMKLDKKLIMGLVLSKGSTNSHISILTRMLEIPCIVSVEGLEVNESLNGNIGIVDACKGEIIINADSNDISQYNKIRLNYLTEITSLKEFIGKKTYTFNHKKIKIYANIASSYEVDNVIKNDGEGIGLFRSEFIYLEAKDYPSEEEQFIHYKRVVEKMNGKEVIIRTLDIGADKKIDYFNLPNEENPALGYRSIRICKDRPKIFLNQLLALYRASYYGNLLVMVPMIISLEEVKFVKEMCEIAKQNLKIREIPFNDKMKIGIMIETPAAAIISDTLANYVDFFSIGTNDLSQYVLALDRVNPLLDKSFDSHHKAILRLIKLVVENAHKNNINVSICGELARDEEMLPFFVSIGVDELSVSPSYVLKLRKEISKIDTTKVDIEAYIN